MKMNKVIIVIAGLFLIAFNSYAQLSLEEILAKHFEANGLENADSEINKLELEGNMVQNNMKFPITINVQLPGKFRLDMKFNDLTFSKVQNGKTLWEYNPMTDSLQTSQSEELEAVNFVIRWTGGLFFKEKIKASLLGIATVDGIDTYKLKGTLQDGSQLIYYIDKISFHILRIDEDEEGNKYTVFQDYQKTGKYTLAHSMSGYEDGRPSISMQFEKIDFNVPLKSDLFQNPVKH